ncbi:flavin reductase family protein [Marinomonas piezotolerans]|uniref:Flavin reductase family protein n=1 Tax=Marinomonas piezotolerans TaxID=2213058 RepID=A0A370U702_9GAMM|nr:flavin reductase family protein [Marinomonas piezotolerans]RDL43564.1 flavin reductase family protein [Marinomonas piezotolerans]
MDIKATELNTQSMYRLLVGGVTPRPIAWISTLSADGVQNLAPYSFFSVASVNPPVLSFTQVTPQTGKDKDTLRNIIATQECVVNIVTSEQLEVMNATCANLDSDVSEFVSVGVEHQPSYSVAPWSVTKAPVRYECRLREVIRITEKPGGGCLVLLDVIHVVVDDRLIEGGQIDQSLLDSVGKMGGDYYCSTDHLRALKRP